jgi:hypothetical protein
MKKPLIISLLLLWSGSAFGQGAVLQGGSRASGHAPMYIQSGSSGQTIVQDSGPASGGTVGLGLSELLRVARGTGTPPYAGQGTGPLGTTDCQYDAPTNNATGYHYFCMSPNAQGGGLFVYGAGGAASALPFKFIVNGTSYPFPFSTSGVVGPGTTTVGHFAVWNNTVGTLLADTNTPSAASYALNGNVVLYAPTIPTPASGFQTDIMVGLGSGVALTPNLNTEYLTCVGFNSCHSLTTADHITAIGAWTGASATTALTHSTIIGIDALRLATAGTSIVAIGEHAMTGIVTAGQHGVAVGTGAGYYMGGDYNTAIGDSALLGQVGSPLSGQGNTGVGGAALINISGAAATNSAFGYFAGLSLTTGSGNIFMGYLTGSTLTTGSNNILLGQSSDVPSASSSNYLNIGGWLYGDAANFIRVKGSLGTKPAQAIATGTTGTVAADDSAVIINPSGAFTLTLPSAATYPGRWLTIKTVGAQTISSASANVVPLAGGALATPILAATAGKWAELLSNGTYWEIMAGN